jgi:integrase
MGLGAYPDVPLAGARERARAARERIWNGVNPIEHQAQQRSALAAAAMAAVTFEDAAGQYIASKASGWSNVKHGQQWQATLEQHAYPHIGKLLVKDIQLPQVLAVLQPIWTSKTETASRLRQRIEAVLSFATVRGWRQGPNPAIWKGNLATVLPAPAKVTPVQHHPAMPFGQVHGFWQQLQAMEGNGAAALRAVLLSACRSGEVRGMKWSELDLQAKTWTVPAERMKARQAHTVPLSPAMLQLLEQQPRIAGCDFVFPSSKGEPLSDMTLSACMRRLELPYVPHGLRSTFRDWAAETTSHANHVVEMALAHAVKGVEGAYRRGDLLQQRRRLMDDWARYVTEGGAKLLQVAA